MNRDDDIFAEALTVPAGERAAFLDQACGADVALRARVEALLASNDAAARFFAAPLTSRVSLAPEEKPGDWIGRYKLLQKIGEGGCGVVWMAEQEEPVRRRIALKVIKLGMDTKAVIARFEAERQALALMDHVNIAKVYDAGATDTGRPYFVMELVRGTPITKFCDENNLTPAERLALFIKVCHAVQHAHQKGIIHRDLKPSNILVTVNDGAATPKLIDFGIAKATQGRLTDATMFTAFEQFIGTPAYMSPEQAEMSSLDIDTRSDIYSLGVLLYELLTGKPPFDPATLRNAGLDEVRRIIREVEPARPSTRLNTLADSDRSTIAAHRRVDPAQLSTLLRSDLDWIVMKAIEKRRSRRYETANGLASDIQRYLQNEPIVARPPSTAYLLQKLVQRHRVVFIGAGAVTAALVLGTLVSLLQAIRASRAEREQAQLREIAEMSAEKQSELRLRAETGEQDARRAVAALRRTTYDDEMNIAQQALVNGNLNRATQLLDQHRPRSGEEDLRGFEWRYLWGQARSDEEATLGAHRGSWGGLAISPDGLLLANSISAAIEIRSLQTRTVVTTLTTGAGGNGVLRFSSDGRWLLSGTDRGIRRWRAGTWKEEALLSEVKAPFAVARDRPVLVGRAGRRLTLWSTESWSKLADLPGELPRSYLGHQIQAIAVSPDGNRVFYGADEHAGIRTWNLDTMMEEAPIRLSKSAMVQCLATSPDGLLAAAQFDGRVTVWDTTTRQLKHDYLAHRSWITSVAFSPDGSLVASASQDQTVVVHDVSGRAAPRRLSGHRGMITSLAFSPDGASVISGSGFDRSTRLWAARETRDRHHLITGETALSFMDSGRGLICWSAKEGFRRYDLSTRGLTAFGAKPVPVEVPGIFYLYTGRLRLSPNLSTVAQMRAGEVEIWNILTGEKENVLKHETGKISRQVFSADGSVLVTTGERGEIRLWKTGAWTSEALKSDLSESPRVVALSANGRSLAVYSGTGTAQSLLVFDLSSRAPPVKLKTTNVTFSLLFNLDASILYTGRYDGSICIFDLGTQKEIAVLGGHLGAVMDLALSPDGRTLASCGDDHLVKLWNVASRQEILTLPSLRTNSGTLLFSSDGTWLVVNSAEERLQLWHAPSWTDIEATEKRAKAP